MNNSFLEQEELQLLNILMVVIDREMISAEFHELFRAYDKSITKKEIFSIIQYGEFYLRNTESYLKLQVNEYYDDEKYTLVIRGVELILKGLN